MWRVAASSSGTRANQPLRRWLSTADYSQLLRTLVTINMDRKVRLGVDTTAMLLEAAGPAYSHKQFISVHVGGTNGITIVPCYRIMCLHVVFALFSLRKGVCEYQNRPSAARLRAHCWYEGNTLACADYSVLYILCQTQVCTHRHTFHLFENG
jgi:hypothetical protein